jgi:small-conductance mechanosensitive channel
MRRLLLCVVAFWAAWGSLAAAQPAGLTPQQYDQLIRSVSAAVAEQLAARPPVVPAATEPEDEQPVAHRLVRAADALPAAFATLAALPEKLSSPDLSVGRLVYRLAGALAAALVAEWALRWLLGGVRRRWAGPDLKHLAGLFVLDAAAVALFVAVMEAHAPLWSQGTPAQAALGQAVIYALSLWRLNVLVLRAWLRPDLPAARIAPVNDGDAARILYAVGAMVGLLMAIVALMIFMYRSGTAPAEFTALALLNNPVLMLGFLATILAVRRPMASWLHNLVGDSRLGARVATHWWIGGIVFYLVLSVAQIHGILSGNVRVARGLNLTQMLVVGWLLYETLSWHLARLRAQGDRPHPSTVVIRCLRMLVRVALVVVIADIWVSQVLALVPPDQFRAKGLSLAAAGATVFGAYVLWQVARFHIDTYIANHPLPSLDPLAMEPEGEVKPDVQPAASRLRTLLPLLRVAVAMVLLIVTVMVVLSSLGVDTAPLIAGASIFGLAISFGSQALVRDIVSGIFYLADDAFRVGEYIDTGKAKGTVENFTLRSLRLRHQNGQVHTIPFGQLGAVTNFSRDWTTVKFSLRFTRGTDLEAVRKVAKKLGQAMFEEPEFRNDLLMPLKMQGVEDITENALVVRFKFTARPKNPSFIQRQAIRRMIDAFAKAGIAFAHPTVSVQGMGGEAAAAAASMAAQPAPTPAA